MLKDRSVLRHCFIELFAGCGANVLGFMNTGLKCLAAVEWEIAPVHSMWHNLALNGFSNLKVSADKIDALRKAMRDDPTTNNNNITHIPDNDWLSKTNEVSPIMNVYCMDITKLSPYQIMEDLGIKSGELGIISGGPPCQGFSTAGLRDFNDPRNKLPLTYIEYI